MALGQSSDITLRIRADHKQASDGLEQTAKDVKKLEKDAVATGKAIGEFLGNGLVRTGQVAAAAAVSIAVLTKTTADYGNALLELQRKTGITSETLSALRVNAEKAGVSFEDVKGIVEDFTVKLGEAAAGDKDAAESLAKYGVTAKSTEAALEQAIAAIARKRTAEERAAAATALLGDEGKELIPVIIQMSGSLSRATEEAKKLGQTMSQSALEDAKRFSDELKNVSTQAAATGRTFAGPLLRDFTGTMSEMSSGLAKNKGEVKAWGEDVAKTIRGLKAVAQEVYDFSQTTAGRALSFLFFGNLITWNKNLQDMGGPAGPAGAPLPNDIPGRPLFDPLNLTHLNPTTPGKSGTATDTEAAKAAAEKRAREREAALKRELEAQKDHIRLLIQTQVEGAEKAQQLWEQSFLDRKTSEDEWRDVSEGNFQRYSEKVKKMLRDAFLLDSQGKTPAEVSNLQISLDRALKAVDDQIVKLRGDREKTITGVVETEAKKRTEIEKQEAASQLAIARAKGDTYIANLKEDLALGILSESEYARKVGDFRVALLQQERALTESLDERLVLDERIAQQILENSKAIRDAWGKEADAYQKLIDQQKERELVLPNTLETPTDATQTGGSTKSLFGLGGSLKEVTTSLAEMGKGAISSFANGVGSIVEQFVLLGTAGPNAMRKLTASVLAGLAAQAAVKSLFYLAEGIAALFWNPAAAAGFFQASAIMAGIALGAGGAGRAVAGSAFQQSSSGSSAFGSSTSSNAGLNFTNPFGGFGAMQEKTNNVLAAVTDRTNAMLGYVGEVVERLDQKITTATPGAVFVAGIDGNENNVFNAVNTVLENDGTRSTQLFRSLGMYY